MSVGCFRPAPLLEPEPVRSCNEECALPPSTWESVEECPDHLDNRVPQGLVRSPRVNCLYPAGLTYQSFSGQLTRKAAGADAVVPRLLESPAKRGIVHLPPEFMKALPRCERGRRASSVVAMKRGERSAHVATYAGGKSTGAVNFLFLRNPFLRQPDKPRQVLFP